MLLDSYLILPLCSCTPRKICSCSYKIESLTQTMSLIQLSDLQAGPSIVQDGSGFCTYGSLAGSLKSFQPSGAMISVIDVRAKTTREKGRHALPSQMRPVPPMELFTNEKPVLSSFETLPWAVTTPLITFCPAGTGLAIDINWQFCYTNVRLSKLPS